MRHAILMILGLVACGSDQRPGDILGVEAAIESPDTTVSGSCEIGAQDCDGQRVKLCLDGRWWTQEPPCELTCYLGHCAVCLPGHKDCLDSLRVRVCKADGSGMENLAACPEGLVCRWGECVPSS